MKGSIGILITVLPRQDAIPVKKKVYLMRGPYQCNLFSMSSVDDPGAAEQNVPEPSVNLLLGFYPVIYCFSKW